MKTWIGFALLPLLALSPSLLFASNDDRLSEPEASYLREAFAVAQSSRDHGSHPFGALLLCEGKVFLKSENHVEQNQNPMRHAEMDLLAAYVDYRKASEEGRRELAPDFEGRLPDIRECQMYASTQPCQMCEGAIHTMKVGDKLIDKPQVIFGLDKGGLSELVRGYRAHDRSVRLQGPHLLEEARKPHEGFWRK